MTPAHHQGPASAGSSALIAIATPHVGRVTHSRFSKCLLHWVWVKNTRSKQLVQKYHWSPALASLQTMPFRSMGAGYRVSQYILFMSCGSCYWNIRYCLLVIFSAAWMQLSQRLSLEFACRLNSRQCAISLVLHHLVFVKYTGWRWTNKIWTGLLTLLQSGDKIKATPLHLHIIFSDLYYLLGPRIVIDGGTNRQKLVTDIVVDKKKSE